MNTNSAYQVLWASEHTAAYCSLLPNRCAHCGSELIAGVSIVTGDALVMCECGKCNSPIKGDVVKALRTLKLSDITRVEREQKGVREP